MKRIKLTQGKYTLVDNDDYEYLSQWKWRYHNLGYAVRTMHVAYINGKAIKKEIMMHRLIMNPEKGMVIDHKNRNKLDNRRANLRVCTQAKNRLNSIKKSNNTSGYIGVCWDKTKNKWLASIHLHGKQKYLGRYDTAQEASKVRDEAAKQYYGEYGMLNVKKT